MRFVTKETEQEYSEFLENHELQPTSLRFIMSGINIDKFASWLKDFDTDRDYWFNMCIDKKDAYIWQYHVFFSWTCLRYS